MKKSRLQELAGIKEAPQFQQTGAGVSSNKDQGLVRALNLAFLADDGTGSKPNHTRGISPQTAAQIKKQYQVLDKALIGIMDLMEEAFEQCEEHYTANSDVLNAIQTEYDKFEAMDNIINTSALPQVKM